MKIVIIVLLMMVMSGCAKSEEVVVNDTSVYEYDTDMYYGYLIIPKIEMKKGFYNTDSRLNNVNKNVTLLESNILNTYILAAHSGTGSLAYFNNLRYLEVGDDVYLMFRDRKIHYKVVNIRNEVKNGKIHIKNKENMIILTTCDQEKKGYQLIIEGEEVI